MNTTTTIKCVIVEDEQHTTMLMENYVSQLKQLELLGSFISPVELLSFDRLQEVQLIYLDIQMPQMTGVEFLKSIPVQAEVIFTTAYSEYALEGYELNITDYLLKPVELPRFIQASNKAIEQILLKQQTNKPIPQEHLMLKVDKKLVKVFVKDIVFIQSDWNYIHVHTAAEKYMVLSTMKNMESELSAYTQFIRIHKSSLINLDYFEFIEGNMVQVHGEKLHVSRSFRNDLMTALGM